MIVVLFVLAQQFSCYSSNKWFREKLRERKELEWMDCNSIFSLVDETMKVNITIIYTKHV